METAVLISIIVSTIMTGVGLWLVLFAVKHGGHRRQRNPELVKIALETAPIHLLDGIMDRRITR